MSKKYKQKHNIENNNTISKENNGLSKKDIYDLKQKEKREQKEKKLVKKNKNKSKKRKKTYSTSLGARIFAIVMLILMVGSVIAAISSYFMGSY